MTVLKHMHANNRKNLCKKLPKGIVVGLGQVDVIRNSDVHYPFRQESNFLYLSGIQMPDFSFILLLETNQFFIFMPKIDAKHVVWLGKIPSPTEIQKEYGASKVGFLDQFETVLSKFHPGKQNVYVLGSKQSKLWKKTAPYVHAKNQKTLSNCMAELRYIKSEAEINLLQTSAKISALGHRAAMDKAKPGKFEYEIQSYIEHVFRLNGASQTAYGSIVASGKNSAVLHYFQNNAKLKAGDLLLIDAGCEVEGYAADITRTFAVSGKLTSPQKEIYEIVLNAQKKAIQNIRPGRRFRELHDLSSQVMLEGLKDMGLLKGNVSDMFEAGVEKLFFPHGLGHPLGLDVHDVSPVEPQTGVKKKKGQLRANVKLEVNSVWTVEPGIYFIDVLLKDPKNRKKFKDFVHWPKVDQFLNFGGIRIEDDVVVTSGTPKILTASCPK